MPNLPRETVYAALFTQLQNLVLNGSVAQVKRRVTMADVNSPGKMPAIYIDGDKETVERQAGAIQKVTMEVRLFVYVDAPDLDKSPGTKLSNVLDAIDAMLAPPPGVETQTLGGLVGHCWVDGEIERFEVGIPNKAMALVPVKMIVMRV